MTDSIEVKCITHTGSRDAYGHITGIGGKNPNGENWWLSEAAAIQGMKEGKWNFYVNKGGRTVKVIRESRNGHEYLKTEADDTRVDNLLSLPPCPV